MSMMLFCAWLHVWRSKPVYALSLSVVYMHNHMSGHLHTILSFPASEYITFGLYLQLQCSGDFFFFFFFCVADTAEGPKGLGRLQTDGRQRQERHSREHSSHTQSIRELNMRYDCKDYMSVFLKRSQTLPGTNVWKGCTVVKR